MAIIPVPTSRSSDLLLRSRLIGQLQQHQMELLRIQDRLSTGLRIARPSDDSPAASRAMRLQMLLEQKEQNVSNLQATAGYLAAADSAVATLTTSLIEVRGLAISVNNSTTSDVERQAAVQQIRLTVDQLMRIGNREFRGRYLFSGSRSSTVPFEVSGRHVAYRGNDKTLASFVDLGLLQDANLPADRLLGVYSPGVVGTGDLGPVLTEQTRLADLNGGRGIGQGSFQVSDGISTSTIDIRSAVTVGDVVRLIENNPPGGRELIVRVTPNGLWLDLDDDGLGGNLTVHDLSGSTTAAELGILHETGTGVGPIIGADLDPIVRPTTPLSNVLGVRASALMRAGGANNDLVLEAKRRGADFHGYHVHLVDDAGLQAAPGVGVGGEFATFSAIPVAARAGLTFSGQNNNLVLTAKNAGTEFNGVQIEIVNAGVIGNNATVSYNATSKVLSIGIDALGQTEVQTVIQQLDLNSPFTAAYDSSLAAEGGYVPTAKISAADVGVVSGNTGNSGGDANTIFVHVAAGGSTANHVVAAIQNSPVVSELVSARVDPKDTAVADAAGQGVVDASARATLIGGSGVEFDQQSGLRIVNAGVTYTIDVSEAETVEDLLNTINNSGANVAATINATSSGIDVRSVLAGADLSIGENGGLTATQLGIRSLTSQTPLTQLNHGLGVHREAGIDFTIVRNDGIELDIDVSSAVTFGDVIDIINQHPSNQDAGRITARLAQFGNGLELVDESAEGVGTLTVQKRASHAVWDLGLVPRGSDSATAGTPPASARADVAFPSPNDLNTALSFTVLPPGSAGNDIQIVFANTGAVVGDNAAFSFDAANKVLTIDIDPSATTANSVVTAFAGSPQFTVALNTMVDPTNDGTGVLGFTGSAGTTSGGVAETLQSNDVNPFEVKGLFNTLIKLADALEAKDGPQIERTMALLLEDLDRLNYGRAEMGSRGQFLDTIKARIDDEAIQLRETLSNEIDADVAETISELSLKQTALQASLQLVGRTFQLTLLDFL